MSSIIITILLSIFMPLTLLAAPSTGPSGEHPGGIFSVYFQNATGTSCDPGEYITGFSSSTLTYMQPVCSPLSLGSTLAWTRDGTTTTLGDYLGTKNNLPLIFKTYSERDTYTKMILMQNGNLGIATESPQYALSVSGTIAGSILTATGNGTWFSWGPLQMNYIRGNTYLSGVLLDEQNITYRVDPDKKSILHDVEIMGTMSGRAPTANEHFATKGYVDAAVSAAGYVQGGFYGSICNFQLDSGFIITIGGVPGTNGYNGSVVYPMTGCQGWYNYKNVTCASGFEPQALTLIGFEGNLSYMQTYQCIKL